MGKVVSKAIDRTTGGDGVDPGLAQVTPDQVDFAFGQVTGGTGRESLKLFQYLESKVTGDKLPENRVPIKGMFYGETKSEQSVTGKYYTLEREINIAENQLKARNSAEAKTAFLKENPEAQVVSQMKSANSAITRFNKQRKAADARGDKEEAKRLDGLILDRRIGVIEAFEAAKRKE